MRSKKAISSILALILVVTFYTMLTLASASSSSPKTEILQQSIQSQVDNIQSNKTLADTTKIEKLVKLFFNAKESINKDGIRDIDLSIFLKDNKNNFDSNKIKNAAKLRKALQESSGLTITSDNLTLSMNNIDIKNDIAIVTLYELYEYQLSSLDVPSSRGIDYTVNLSKTNGNWVITSITTNDEFITEAMGSDTFNVEKAMKNALSNESNVIASSDVSSLEPSENASVSPVATSGTFHPIVRSTAAGYATAHATLATYNNAQFPSSADDCANFGSQCVWAGCGGTTTYDTTYVAPMYSIWYSTKGDYTEAWRTVSSFYDASVGGGTELSAVNMGNQYVYIQPGDILQLYNGSYYFHTYVVSAVTGVYGSRTLGDIYISAHTVSHQNEPLAYSYSGAFRHIEILGATY